MEPAEAIFKRKSYRVEGLLRYGFQRDKNGFTYEALILDGQFKLVIDICGNEIKTEVIETALEEPYILYHVDGASGAFLGQIRGEVEKILLDVAEKCFYTEIFKSRQAKMLIEYALEKYGDKAEYLWEKFPDNAVFRRKDNQKWYGVIMTVNRKKLGLNGDGTVEVADLREEPEAIAALVDGKNYHMGYHMNKQHWYTVYLNDSLSDEDLKLRIDRSYLSLNKR